MSLSDPLHHRVHIAQDFLEGAILSLNVGGRISSKLQKLLGAKFITFIFLKIQKYLCECK